MALFSDVDWVIIAAVAAILFLGPQGQPFVRQMGRWYGRLLRFKAEMMSEVTLSVGASEGTTAPRASIRAAILGIEPPSEPAAVPITLPSQPGVLTYTQPVGLWAVETQSLGAGLGVLTWWAMTTSSPGEVVRLR